MISNPLFFDFLQIMGSNLLKGDNDRSRIKVVVFLQNNMTN